MHKTNYTKNFYTRKVFPVLLSLCLLSGIFIPAGAQAKATIAANDPSSTSKVNSNKLVQISESGVIENPISSSTSTTIKTSQAPNITSSNSVKSETTSTQKDSTTAPTEKSITKSASSEKASRAGTTESGKLGTATWNFDGSVLTIGAGTYVAGTDAAPSWSSNIKSNATSVVFSGLLTATGSLEGLFSNFTQVTTYSNINTNLQVAGVTSLKTMFQNNTKLTDIDLHSWDTSNVVDFSYMFAGDTSLTNANLSQWSTASAGWKNNFMPNSPLTVLQLPNNFFDKGDGGPDNMFKNYSDDSGTLNLTYGGKLYTLSNYSRWFVLPDATSDAPDIVWELTNSNTHLHILGGTFPNWPHWEYYFTKDTVKLITLETKVNTGSMAQNLLQGFANVTEIKNGSNLDLSNATNIEHLLQDDAKLTTLDVSEWNVSNIVNMGGAFQNTQITKLDVSHWDVSKVTSFWDTFTGVRTQILDFSGWNTNNTGENAPNGNGATKMISGATELNRVIFGPNFDIQAVMPPVDSSHPGNWVGVGSGSISTPNGKDLTATNSNTYTGTSSDEGTYIKSGYKYNADIDFWEPNTSANQQLNQGSYGSAGYTNRVLEKSPWTDKYNESQITSDNNVIETVAKGIWGPDAATGIKWYIDTSGTLHLHAGTGFNTTAISNTVSPFQEWSAVIKKIQIDGTLVLPAYSQNLFTKFSNLTEISATADTTTPFDTSNVVNMANMFSDNPKLTSLPILTNWNATNVTTTYGMFNNDNSITELDLTGWKTSSKLTDMGYMFGSVGNASKITLPDTLDTSGVTSMNRTFNGTQSVTELNVKNWNVSKVTDMTAMFFNNSNLQKLDLSGWTTSSVITMPSIFKNVSKLTSLDLSGFDTSKATNLQTMFESMSALKQITFSSKFVTTSVTDTSNLPYLPNTTATLKWRNIGTGSVTDPTGDVYQPNASGNPIINSTTAPVNGTYVLDEMQSRFWSPGADSKPTKNLGTYGDTGLTLYVYKSNPWQDVVDNKDITDSTKVQVKAKGIFGNDVTNGAKWYIDMNDVLHIGSGQFADTPKAGDGTGVTYEASPFYKYPNITKVIIEGNVVAAPYSSNLFGSATAQAGFTKLTSFEVAAGAKFDTSKVTSMKSMFNGASVLARIDLADWNTTNVTDMSFMFAIDYGLTTLDLSAWDVSNLVTAKMMFFGDSNLTAVDVSTWKPTKLQNSSMMFEYDTALTTLDVSNWETPSLVDASEMFMSAIKLSNLDLRKWQPVNLQNAYAMFAMFSDKSALTSLNVSTWTTPNLQDMGMAFRGTSLKELDLSNWNTSGVKNMLNSFDNMNSLQKITVGPNFVTTGITNSANYPFLPNVSITKPNVKQWVEVAPEKGGTDTTPLGSIFRPTVANNPVVDNDHPLNTKSPSTTTWVLSSMIILSVDTVDNNNPQATIAGVIVDIYDSNNNLVYTGKTDSTGHLDSPPLPKGSYTIKQGAHVSGYTDANNITLSTTSTTGKLVLRQETTDPLPITGSNALLILLGSLLTGLLVHLGYSHRRNRKDLKKL